MKKIISITLLLLQYPSFAMNTENTPLCTADDIEYHTEPSGDNTSELTVDVKVKKESNCLPGKNLLYFGLSAGSMFYYGGNALWVHRNSNKNRPVFHVEFEHQQRSFVQSNTLGFGAYVGKQGIFAGVKAGELRVHNDLIDGEPVFKFKVVGVDMGMYHAWGQKKRIITGLKLSMLLVPNPEAPAVLMEGRGYLGFKLLQSH